MEKIIDQLTEAFFNAIVIIFLLSLISGAIIATVISLAIIGVLVLPIAAVIFIYTWVSSSVGRARG